VSRSLHLPPARSGETAWYWKLLPFLAAAAVLALIWAERRGERRNGARLGTAPAGAPPLPERDPARPTTGVNPLLERPAPYAAPGTTAGATPASGAASAGAAVAAQPAPLAAMDAPGTASPETLAAAGPDLAAWHGELAGDTDGADEAATAAAGEASDQAAGNGAAETIPTPAEESTAIPRSEGVGWVRGDGTAACPPAYPIKGNATSRIYHRPGEASYEATVPEICFATEDAATELGYRPRKR
jgi:hypothetical protein